MPIAMSRKKRVVIRFALHLPVVLSSPGHSSDLSTKFAYEHDDTVLIVGFLLPFVLSILVIKCNN